MPNEVNAATVKNKSKALNPSMGAYKGSEELSGTEEDSEDSADDAFLPKRKTHAPPPDPFADWDNGEELTPQQRKDVLALKSNYERARVMNKIQNDRKLRELELKNEVVKTFAGLKGDKAKAKKSATSVAHGKGSREKK